jgi:hypothetical protein
MTTRRFPPPWTVVEHAESYKVQDATGQAVGWFYFRRDPEVASQSATAESPTGGLVSLCLV